MNSNNLLLQVFDELKLSNNNNIFQELMKYITDKEDNEEPEPYTKKDICEFLFTLSSFTECFKHNKYKHCCDYNIKLYHNILIYLIDERCMFYQTWCCFKEFSDTYKSTSNGSNLSDEAINLKILENDEIDDNDEINDNDKINNNDNSNYNSNSKQNNKQNESNILSKKKHLKRKYANANHTTYNHHNSINKLKNKFAFNCDDNEEEIQKEREFIKSKNGDNDRKRQKRHKRNKENNIISDESDFNDESDFSDESDFNDKSLILNKKVKHNDKDKFRKELIKLIDKYHHKEKSNKVPFIYDTLNRILTVNCRKH